MRGLNLLEFIITLSIISVILLFALPIYHDIFEQHQANIAISYLKRAIYFARSEAIWQQRLVRLTPNDKWENGISISINGQEIKFFPPISTNGRIIWQGFPAYNYLQFTPQGFTYYQNGSFYYLSSQGKVIKRLIINQAGRVRVE